MEGYLMDETKRDPIEDIFLIRQVLERATSGMRSLAPWFIRFGLVWLLYGGFSAAYARAGSSPWGWP